MRRSHHTRCLSPTKRSDLARLLFVAFALPIVAPGCLASRRDRFPGFALLRCLRVATSLALVCDHREYAPWCSGSYDFAFASSLLPLRRGTPTASPGRRAALPSTLARFGSSACLPSVNDASPRFAGSSTRVLSLSRASPASSGARRVDSNPDFSAVVQARLRVVRDLRAVERASAIRPLHVDEPASSSILQGFELASRFVPPGCGVTRSPKADPLLTLIPPGSAPRRLGSRVSASASFHGLLCANGP
jgi:hypothetical protein